MENYPDNFNGLGILPESEEEGHQNQFKTGFRELRALFVFAENGPQSV
jgi:hypothetical protein